MPLWDVDLFKSTKDPAVLEQRQIALANGNVVAQGTLDWGGKMSRECQKAMKQKAKDATGKQPVQFEVIEWSLERKESDPANFKFIVWVSSGRVWYSIKSISSNWTAYTQTSLAIQTLSALAQAVSENQTLDTSIVLQKVAQALSRSADDIATLLSLRAQFFHKQLLVFVFDNAEPKSIHPKCPVLRALSRAFRHGRAITPSPPPLLVPASTSPAPSSPSVAAQPRQRPPTPTVLRPASAAAAVSARAATPSRPPSRTSSRLRGAPPEVDVPDSRDNRVESRVVEPAEPSGNSKVADLTDFGGAGRDYFGGETGHVHSAGAGAEDGGCGGAVPAQQQTVGATRRKEQEPAVKREGVVDTAAPADVDLKAQVRRAEPDLTKSVVVEVPMYPSMRCQFESCNFVGGAWDDLFAHYASVHDLPFPAPDGAAMDVDQDETDEIVELPPIRIAKRPPLPNASPSLNSRPFHFHRTRSMRFEPRAKPAFRLATLAPPREPSLPAPVPVAKLFVLPSHDELAGRMRAFTVKLEPAWAEMTEESDDEDGEVAPPCPSESAVANSELADAFDYDVDMNDVDEPAFPAATGFVDGAPSSPARDAAPPGGPAAVPVVPEREPSLPPAPLIDLTSDVEDGATIGGDRAHASAAVRIALNGWPSQRTVDAVGATEPILSRPPSPPGSFPSHGTQLPEATLGAPLPVSEPVDLASDVGAVEDGAVAGGDHALAAAAALVVPLDGPRPRLIDAVGGTDLAPLLPPSPPRPSPSHGTQVPEAMLEMPSLGSDLAPAQQLEPAQPALTACEPSPALAAASPVHNGSCVVISDSESSSPGSPPLPAATLPANLLGARPSVPTTPTPRPTPEPNEALAAAPARPARGDAPEPTIREMELDDSDDDEEQIISSASQPAAPAQRVDPPPPPPPPIEDDDDDEVQFISPPRRPPTFGAFGLRAEPAQSPPRYGDGNLMRGPGSSSASQARPTSPAAWGRQTRPGVAPLPESVTSSGAPPVAPDRRDTGWFWSQQLPPGHHGNEARSPPPPPPPRHPRRAGRRVPDAALPEAAVD
ncbi:hypothetical protein AMAG_02537 [Allomyces macrogynus ATCC 38327]|uniref:Uncharacterized protein n=1 Tax=Allomyces macrogynus (strain ATCC 38327) TaxID=578462 RepID=A0A0L0S2Y3_ALLM3|nr:hypothetical protein AMAG_02537 [Allomyces macrogynus ATCC 38327]|eukprot:KNE56761.1 hypothetical protein AMAG_02537 [Allomyces macrogynus ATCC 38327]